jgi:hypothetical protein
MDGEKEVRRGKKEEKERDNTPGTSAIKGKEMEGRDERASGRKGEKEWEGQVDHPRGKKLAMPLRSLFATVSRQPLVTPKFTPKPVTLTTTPFD